MSCVKCGGNIFKELLTQSKTGPNHFSKRFTSRSICAYKKGVLLLDVIELYLDQNMAIRLVAGDPRCGCGSSHLDLWTDYANPGEFTVDNGEWRDFCKAMDARTQQVPTKTWNIVKCIRCFLTKQVVADMHSGIPDNSCCWIDKTGGPYQFMPHAWDDTMAPTADTYQMTQTFTAKGAWTNLGSPADINYTLSTNAHKANRCRKCGMSRQAARDDSKARPMGCLCTADGGKHQWKDAVVADGPIEQCRRCGVTWQDSRRKEADGRTLPCFNKAKHIWKAHVSSAGPPKNVP